MSHTDQLIELQIDKDEHGIPAIPLASAATKKKAEEADVQRQIAFRIRMQKQAAKKLRVLRGAIKEEVKRQSDNIVAQNEQKLMIAFANGFGIVVGIEILVPDEAITTEASPEDPPPQPLIEVVPR